MGKNSKIEWTDHTANFWWGCFKVSDGCKNCYADTWAKRWGKHIWGHPSTTNREPKKSVWANVRKWNKEAKESGKRKKVFCMSMGDFFEDHPQVAPIRKKAIELFSECTFLDFQVLTKRIENVNGMVFDATGHFSVDWFHDNPHVWIGTSVENQIQADKRIPELLNIPAKVRFLSMEPLLGDVNLKMFKTRHIHEDTQRFDLINWVIVGGESGNKARRFDLSWAYSIVNQCQDASVPVFVKQFGENPTSIPCGYKFTDKKAGNWDEWPEDLRVREYPNV